MKKSELQQLIKEEILKELSNDNNPDNTFGIDNLTDQQRTQVEEELIKHFKFERISL